MSMTQESSAYFEQVAGQWDQLRSGYFGEAVRETAIAKAYLRPEMVVADIGAGTGFITAGLAPLVKRVYVVDGSAAMLAVAQKNLSQFSNIEYHEADGLSLPFPDESLDAVFANMYLHHCPDPLAAIREMVRVLVPGGRLVITDMDEHPFAWLKDEMADVWQGFDRDQIRAWFKEADLVNVIVDCTGQSCCATSASTEQASDADSGCGCSDSQPADDKTARISVFVATGSVRMNARDAVQNTYGERAAAAGSASCCTYGSDSCCSSEAQSVEFQANYSDSELESAPKEAADISLGCGNPVALANLREGEVVLDIGSGGGLDSFIAAKQVGPQGKVIGVDMTPAMLERARASAQRSGIRNVEFRQGYAEELPVEDGTVDVILSNCVINLTEDKGRVFREAFRVLKPGGRLEVSDVVLGGPMPVELRSDLYGWAECVTGALPEREYLDLIAQAGFAEPMVRHSKSSGNIGDVPVYSAIVSAKKPA